MKHSLMQAFTSKGVFLNQKISVHFSLHKGGAQEKKLGSFALDIEGSGNLLRKAMFLLLFASFFLFLPFLKKKDKKFLKRLDNSTKMM